MKNTLTAAKENKTVKILSILCPLIYFASYLTRKNYSIVIAAVIEAEQLTESAASLAETAALISYGAGQIISGILGDRFKPQRVILCGLISTTVLNAVMPFCGNAYLRAAVWCANGFAQSMLWPPLVRIMAAAMDEIKYNKVCVNVNVAGISGTIFLYISASSLWIKYFSWKYVFFSSAIICAVIAVLWVLGFKKTDKTILDFSKKSTGKNAPSGAKITSGVLLASGFIPIAFAIIAQGALRDGVTTWIPSFLSSTFNLDSSNAILKSVALPIFGVISLKIAGFLQKRFFPNALKGASVIFAVGFVCCFALIFGYAANEYFAMLLAALITGCMHGVNFYLVCIVPAKFERYGIVSTISGIINSLTYVGSAAATWGFAKISESFSWNATVISWAIIAALGTLCCLITVKRWAKFTAAGQAE